MKIWCDTITMFPVPTYYNHYRWDGWQQFINSNLNRNWLDQKRETKEKWRALCGDDVTPVDVVIIPIKSNSFSSKQDSAHLHKHRCLVVIWKFLMHPWRRQIRRNSHHSISIRLAMSCSGVGWEIVRFVQTSFDFNLTQCHLIGIHVAGVVQIDLCIPCLSLSSSALWKHIECRSWTSIKSLHRIIKLIFVRSKAIGINQKIIFLRSLRSVYFIIICST